MSITCIQNVGQYGNQLFPTVLACTAALKHGLRVDHFENRLVKFHPPPRRDATYEKTAHTRDPLSDGHSGKNIVMQRGYYQSADLFNPYRGVIKTQILDLPRCARNTADVVLHLRLDGFNHKGHNSHIIDPMWYVGILRTLSFERLYIVMATKSGRIRKSQGPHKRRYLEAFDPFEPTVVSNDEYTDFNFIRGFDTIISSNSTFSWWAAFCSDATRVFLPPIWESRTARLSSIGDVGIAVHDNFGYVNIETMERVPITYQ